MRVWVFLSLISLLAALCCVVEAMPAYAGGDGAKPGGDARPGRGAEAEDHLAKLTKEERAFLEKRVKGWAELPAHKKQMIARNVLRIRTLSPQQRRHFEERLKRMRGKNERWDRVRDHGARMLLDRGLAYAARKRLGREFEAQLRRRDISDHVFERSFGRLFWDKVRTSAFVGGKPVAPDALPEDLPERLVQRYRQMYARYEAAEQPEAKKRATRMLGWVYASMVSARLRHELARSDVKGPDAYVALAAKRVQQTWPREFAASLEDPDALVRSAENEEIKRSLRRLLRRDGKLMREEALLVTKLIDRWATHNHAEDADAGVQADALIQRLLREDLKVPAEVVAKMPPRDQVEQRAAWVMQLLRRHHGHRGPRGPGKDGRRKGRPGRGMGLRMPKPDGVSDESWGQVQKAWREALRSRRAPEKPESVDQATWDKAMEAWKKRLEALKRRRGG